VENAFLVVYVFELSVKMRSFGCRFWTDLDELLWHCLDFFIVGAGVLDLWLMPAVRVFAIQVLGQDEGPDLGGEGFSDLPRLIRIFRIFRILRLVRLLRAVPPLYRLLFCIMASLKSMQWVLMLALVTLYGASICWTSLVGKGMVYGGETPPDEVLDAFGSVPKSIFSLFRLMSGDTSIIELSCSTVVGKLLIVIFVVLANWSILAILTSVVSDNMIATAAVVAQEDERKQRELDHEERVIRLQKLFRAVDTDDSGAISYQEWLKLLADETLFRELEDATALGHEDLSELFRCLAVKPLRDEVPASTFFSTGSRSPKAARSFSRLEHVEERIMYYETFIEHLHDESLPADKRSELKLMARLGALEERISRRLNRL